MIDECPTDVRALVDAAVAGDRDAFGALYGRYRPNVRGYIGRRVLDHGTAEDLTQEVFRRAFLAMPQYENRGVDFSAFVVTIARNMIVDYMRQATFRATYRASVSPEQLADWADADRWVSPEYRAVHRSNVAALAEAMGRLTDDQRRCLELRFLRDLSVAETAAALGKNEGAVKALQARATSALRRDPALDALR